MSPVRLPLQVGVSSLWSLVRGLATLTPSLVALLFAGALAWEQFERDGVSMGVLGCAVFVFGILVPLLMYSLRHLGLAWRLRASDVVVSDEELRVEGGPHHGFRRKWSELSPSSWEVREEVDPKRAPLSYVLLLRKERPAVSVTRLVLSEPGAPPRVLGEAERAVERQSLRSLFECLSSPGWGSRHTTSAAPTQLACSTCGAPLVPSPTPTTTCAACDSTTVMPEELRGRVEAGLRVTRERARTTRLLSRLLRQPGARRVNAYLGLVAVGLVASWGAAIAAIITRATTDVLRYGLLQDLAFMPLWAALGAFLLVRSRLVTRFALALVTLGYAARRPQARGAPYQCRECGGPLPDAAGAVVLACLYCGIDNVTGLDVRDHANAASHETASIERVLRARRRERWLWTGGALLSAVILSSAAITAARGFEPVGWMKMVPEHFDIPHRNERSNGDGLASAPAISPDGNRLLYVLEPDGKPPELRLVEDPDSYENTRSPHVVPTDREVVDVTWVGVGPAFVYVGRVPQLESHELRLASTRGGTERVLRSARELERPSVDTSGTSVAFAERDEGGWWITVVGTSDGPGQRPRRLAAGRAPAFDPSQPRIAFTRDVEGAPKLFVIDADGSNERQLTRGDAAHVEPAWSVCGEWIVFAWNAGWDAYPGGTADGTWNLVLLSMTDDHDLVPITYGTAAVRRPSVARDAIVFVLDEYGPGDIYASRAPGLIVGELNDRTRACPRK